MIDLRKSAAGVTVLLSRGGVEGWSGRQRRSVSRTALRQAWLAAQIERGDLANLLAGTFGGNAAEREVCFALGFIRGRGYGAQMDVAAEAVREFTKTSGHCKIFQTLIGGLRKRGKTVGGRRSLRVRSLIPQYPDLIQSWFGYLALCRTTDKKGKK